MLIAAANQAGGSSTIREENHRYMSHKVVFEKRTLPALDTLREVGLRVKMV